MTPLICMSDVTKHYDIGAGSVLALRNVFLTVMNNEYVALVGASGSGKSTLMNIIGCLDQATSGRYVLAGRDVSELDADNLAELRNQKVGFVFQNYNLLPHCTALQNVMRPLAYGHVPYSERRERAAESLIAIGLDHRMEHKPSELSGGEKQRVAIARALVIQPLILLADEPTGNLDTQATENTMQLFDQLHGSGCTVIIVTHEADIAARCERVIELSDGRITGDRRRHVLVR